MKTCIKCGHDLPDEAIYCYICGKKQIVTEKKSTKSRGNGTGTVYKQGSSWVAEATLGYTLRPDGTKQRIFKRKKGFKTKKEANAFLSVLLPKTALSAKNGEKLPKITLEHYWLIFSTNRMAKLSESKQVHYNTAHNKIKDIMVADLRTLTISELQEKINEVAPTYYPAKDIKTLLSFLFSMAMAEQVVTVNLAEHIELPKNDEDQPNPFTEQEVTNLWNDYAAGNWFTGYALLMIYTGMMPGELMELKNNMIDLDKKVIVGAGKKTKKRKETPIVLADCIIPVVEDLLHHTKNEYFLPFRGDYYRKKFKAMLTRCNCRPDLVPYSCRHTTATGLALENIAMPVIKEVMRHTKITTTEKYIHIDTAPLLDAVNTLNPNEND